MKEEERILKTIQRFIESALITHDVEAALEVVSDHILGVGINEQGTIYDKAGVRRVLEAQNNTTAFQIAYPRSEIRYHPPGFATAIVVYELRFQMEGRTLCNAFIQTAAARKEGEDWRLCLLQAVPVDVSEETIENYPLKFADGTLTQLRGELQQEAFEFLSKSLSVGILGSYVDGVDLPPFYANESLLNLLEYSKDEFERVMANDSFAVVYPEDRERAQREIAKAIEKGPEYTCQYRLITKSGQVRWIVEHGKHSWQDGREVVLSAFVDITELMRLQMDLKEKNETILSGMAYAGKIQRNLLPSEENFKKAFSDYSILWSPKDIVGGDIYWLRNFPDGAVLCVADCTGHGIPGALLTMLVSTALDNVVREDNYRDTARILYELDRRGKEILYSKRSVENAILDIRDGCDLAVLFVAKDGSVIFSSANTPVFICDGREVRRYRGQRLHIGEGRLKSPGEVERIALPANRDAVYYVATDGLFDQIDAGGGRPFGRRAFQEMILAHYQEKQAEVSQKVWEAFEAHRGSQPPRDDVELISFRP